MRNNKNRNFKENIFILSLVSLVFLTITITATNIHCSQDNLNLESLDSPIGTLKLSQAYGFDTDGVEICKAPGSQHWPELINDDAGGAFITWVDERAGTLDADIYVQRINSSGNAQWTVYGIPVCNASSWQSSPQIISDNAGGVIIAWTDDRTGNSDIYVQRINSTGAKLWGLNGKAVCTEALYQQKPLIVSDGAGGAIIAWQDYRTGSYDIYAQRINSTGDIQWTPNGVALCLYSGYQYIEDIISDGAGGAIVIWRDTRENFFERDVYAQRINSSGGVEWTTDGVKISDISIDQSEPKLCSDGIGGAIITWMDNRSQYYEIYAQRINSTGGIQWTINGTSVSTATANQGHPKICTDGLGGAIITWYDNRNEIDYYDIYAQRINSTGNIQWNNAGNAVCIADNNQVALDIISDGMGGAIIGFTDDRVELDRDDIYAQRIDVDGKIQSTLNGIAVCDYDSSKWGVRLCSDGGEGAIFVWSDQRNSGFNNDIYAQRLLNFDPDLPLGIPFGSFYLIFVFLGVISLVILVTRKIKVNLIS